MGLWIRKNQSAPIWTKLAGVVGSIKKTSWEVILKWSCTLLGSERPKTKNDATLGTKKNSKCSNLDKTCRTGRGHQKNKLGEKKTTKSGGLEVYSERNPHF